MTEGERKRSMDSRTSPEHVQDEPRRGPHPGLPDRLVSPQCQAQGAQPSPPLRRRARSGRCHFCGLSRSRTTSPGAKTFIRVAWPVYSLDEIIARVKGIDQIHRVCLSDTTHPRAIEDTLSVVRRIRQETPFFISVLLSPTLIQDKGPLEAMQEAGTDRVGIAVDAATPEIFDRLRGPRRGRPSSLGPLLGSGPDGGRSLRKRVRGHST